MTTERTLLPPPHLRARMRHPRPGPSPAVLRPLTQAPFYEHNLAPHLWGRLRRTCRSPGPAVLRPLTPPPLPQPPLPPLWACMRRTRFLPGPATVQRPLVGEEADALRYEH